MCVGGWGGGGFFFFLVTVDMRHPLYCPRHISLHGSLGRHSGNYLDGGKARSGSSRAGVEARG